MQVRRSGWILGILVTVPLCLLALYECSGPTAPQGEPSETSESPPLIGHATAPSQELDSAQHSAQSEVDTTMTRLRSLSSSELTVHLVGDISEDQSSGYIELHYSNKGKILPSERQRFNVSSLTTTIRLPEGSQPVLLVAVIDGYLVNSAQFDSSVVPGHVTFDMVRTPGLRCIVTTEDGIPIEGATVQCAAARLANDELPASERYLQASTSITGKSRQDGWVTFSSLPPGDHIRVRAIPPDPYAESILWDCVPGTEVAIVCPEALALWGAVVDPDGQPVEGVNVAAYGSHTSGGEVPLASTITRLDGRFTLPGVPKSKARLRCFAEKAGWSLASADLTHGESLPSEGLILILYPAQSISVKVVSWDGLPVSGLEFKLAGNSLMGVPFTYVTDVRGVARIGAYVVSGAKYRVDAVIGQLVEPIAELIVPRAVGDLAEPLLIRALKLGRLEIGAIDGTQPDEIEAEALDELPSALAILHGSRGEAYLPAGKYSLATMMSGELYSGVIVIHPSSSTRFTWEREVVGITLQVAPNGKGEWPNIEAYTSTNLFATECHSNDESVELSLARGSYFFSLNYSDFAVDTNLYSVHPGDTTIDLRTYNEPLPGKIVGRVEDASGEGVGGLVVHAVATDGCRLPAAVTENDGSFHFTNVSVGEYTITTEIGSITGVQRCSLITRISSAALLRGETVTLVVPPRNIKVDFAGLPGTPERALLIGNDMFVTAELIPGPALIAPHHPDAAWAVMVSRETPEKVNIGGVPLNAAGSQGFLKYTSFPLSSGELFASSTQECGQDEVLLSVNGMPLGVFATVLPTKRVELTWTPGLTLSGVVAHASGRAERFVIKAGEARELRCSANPVGVKVEFDASNTESIANVVIDCCGIRASVPHGELIPLVCEQQSHRVVVSGRGVFPYAQYIAPEEPLWILGLAGQVELISRSAWPSVKLRRVMPPMLEHPLRSLGGSRWGGVQLPAGEFWIIAEGTDGTESARARFYARPHGQSEVEFD